MWNSDIPLFRTILPYKESRYVVEIALVSIAVYLFCEATRTHLTPLSLLSIVKYLLTAIRIVPTSLWTLGMVKSSEQGKILTLH